MTVPGSLLAFRLAAGAEVAPGMPRAAATIPLGSLPGSLVVSPSGSRVYVPIGSPSNTVLVIDTKTNTVIRNPLPFGRDPARVAVSPNGSHIYVTNSVSNTVSVIDTTTNTVVATIEVGRNVGGVAVAPHGSQVYVGSMDLDTNTVWMVSMIDTIINNVITTTSVDGPMTGNPGGPMKLAENRSERSHAHGRRQPMCPPYQATGPSMQPKPSSACLTSGRC